MEYREIVAVTGIGGLFQLLTTKSDGAIVRNLTDRSTKFIPARVHNVTPIESIEIYTIEDNVRLHVVFQAMKDNEATTPVLDNKADNAQIKSYFKSVFPIIDEERVYVSDMKKILKWYELLKANNLLNFDFLYEQATEEEITTPSEEAAIAEPKKSKAKKAEVAEELAEEKPAKKAKAKKAAEASTEESTVKKTARKKKTDEV